MTKMLILSLALFLVANCAIDQSLKSKMLGAVSSISVSYPGGWTQHIINIAGNGEVKSAQIAKSQLDSMGSMYGLPPQVVAKMGAMKWAQNLVLESFSIQVVINHANIQEYIGAAYASGQNVVFATIRGNSWGTIVQKYTTYRKCKKRFLRKKKCWDEKVARGTTEQELSIITQALRARGLAEVQNALSRNDGERLFADIDPLNLLEEGINRELRLKELEF